MSLKFSISQLLTLSSIGILFLFIPIQVFASDISIDQTFGINGNVITSFGNDSHAYSTVIQNDGKIILAGNVSNGSNLDWAITRYNIDGSIDNTFGINGKVIKDLGVNDSIESLKLQTNGELIAGGYTQPTGSYLWTIAKYNTNGTSDINFGNNGFVTTTFNSNLSVLKDIILLSDNKILAIGYSNHGKDEVSVARYNPDGTLDTTFGNGGIVITPIGSSNDRGNQAALQTDGKIVVLGETDAGGHDDIFLARYNSDGSLDATFGNNGKVITQIGSYDHSSAIAIQPDGKIVIAGITNLTTSSDTFVARYNSDGTLDSSFGNNGIVIHSFSSGNDGANSLLLQPDGKILLGGYESFTDPNIIVYALMQFNADGTIDNSFGLEGSYTTAVGAGGWDIPTTITMQKDNKIIAAGYSFNGSYNDWSVTRFQPTNDLLIPLLKQTSAPWQSLEYDSGHIWNPSDPSISAWGCALTSAAMIFQYYGIYTIPGPGYIPLNPGTLNDWLKNQPDGYVGTGWVNWIALSRLSRLAASLNNITAFDALEYKRIQGENKIQLTNDLNNSQPDILEEPGHFIVASGVNGTTFDINDPYYNRKTLNDGYNNTFLSLGRYIPANTDLSYIMITADPSVTLNVTDSQGNSVGSSFIQSPIQDPLDISKKNAPIKIYYLPKPDDSKYTITATNTNKTFQLTSYLYDKNGTPKIQNLNGINANSFVITFDKNISSYSTVKKYVTFSSVIQDIKNLNRLHMINEGFAEGLISLVKNSQKLADKHKAIAQRLLNLGIQLLDRNKNRPYIISQAAYTILLEDFTTLKNSL